MNEPHYNGTAYILVTTLAAALNLLSVLVLCFFVMPRVDRSVIETEKAHRSILHNHEMLEENARLMQDHTRVIRRLNDALDAAEAKAKAAAAKNKK